MSGNAIVSGSVTATEFTATSDYRIKKDVTPISETDYNVDIINPVFYNNIKTNKSDFGVIAHELQEQFPFLVNGEKDGENYQSVNYTGLIGILINEIKQLKKEKNKLQEQINIIMSILKNNNLS